jgi:hypothetical protein
VASEAVISLPRRSGAGCWLAGYLPPLFFFLLESYARPREVLFAASLTYHSGPGAFSRGDERVVARAPARPRRRLEVALVIRVRRGDLSDAAALALALDLDAFRGRWCRGRPARRRPTRRPGGAPRVGRRGARDGALRVLGRAEIRLGAVGAQFLDLRRSTSESVQLVPRRNSIHARFAHDGCDFALVCGIAPEVRQPAA